MGSRTKPLWIALGLLLGAGIAAGFVLHGLAYDFLSDDALIVLRFSRNLISGDGYVFNAGSEPVSGVTSIGWVALTSLLGRLGFDLVDAARGLGLACTLGVGAASAWALREIAGRWNAFAWIPPILLACSAILACWSLSGLYTPAYAMMVLVSLAMATRDRSDPGWAALTGLALFVTSTMRPEGLAIGVTLVGCRALQALWRSGEARRSGLVRAAVMGGACFLLTAALLCWHRAYFGDWLPIPFYAKVGDAAVQMGRGVAYLRLFLAEFGGGGLWFAVLAPCLWRRDAGWWTAVAVFGAQLSTTVYVGGDGLPMYRFLVPATAVWAVLAGVAIAEMVRFVEAVPRLERFGLRRLIPVATTAMLAMWGLVPIESSSQYQLYVVQKNREIPNWTAVGEWLATNARQGESFASVPIGAISYHNQVWCWDMLGKVEKNIAHRGIPIGAGWAGHEKHDGAYIVRQKPTFLFLNNINVLDYPLPFEHPFFVESANPWIRAREGDTYDAPGIEEYERAIAKLPNGRFAHLLVRKDRPRATDDGLIRETSEQPIASAG